MAEWPRDLLDVASLRARGVKPVPFRAFVLKVHSRCNLACRYCYVYEMADQSWRGRPGKMAEEVLAWTIRRISEHVKTHDLRGVRVILHGGEPLLAGTGFIAQLTDALRFNLPSNCSLELSIQTNGILLDVTTLRTLVEHGYSVGVSLDGDEAATDRHRTYSDGRSSHSSAVRALNLLREPRFRASYGGILATIDLDNDPLATYEYLLSHQPPRIDFLLPHGSWSNPPPGLFTDRGTTPYADWLLPIFDRWYGTTPAETTVRMFSEIIQVLLGGVSGVESVGLAPSTLVVVETDGAIRQVDSLSAVAPDAADTGLNVLAHAFDAALDHPGIAARQLGRSGLSSQCQKCSVSSFCGGGLYPHRYRAGVGFLNPSVYCADLFRLINHIRDRVTKDLLRLQP